MKKSLPLIILLACIAMSIFAQQPKHELRATWLATVDNIDWPRTQISNDATREQQKKELTDILDKMAAGNMHACFMQVRSLCDAMYQSSYEPWSKSLTGTRGKDPGYDPLQFAIEEAHKRGLELHIWVNPFRVTSSGTLDSSDKLHQQAGDWIIKYNNGSFTGQIIDPGFPEARQYVINVLMEIVNNYDVDGIVMDDYFYPYPENGMEFEDGEYFKKDNRGFTDKSDWRRDNVNRFIEQIRDTIKTIKPWVKFGISPFGIYRNSSPSYHNGSLTNGLENYSGLYADILYWIEKGWMDYCIPQVYWNTGNKNADYSVLTKWWSENAGNCVMVIGQDVDRTITGTDPANRSMHQQRHKLNLERIMPGLQGNCFWYAKAVVDNVGNYRTILTEEYHQYPALQPVAPTMSQDAPGKVRKVMCLETTDGHVLFWTPSKYNKKKIFEKPVKYVIYRFDKDEEINIEDPSRIITITDRLFINLPYKDGATEYVYVVTALNRLQVESAPVKCKVKL